MVTVQASIWSGISMFSFWAHYIAKGSPVGDCKEEDDNCATRLANSDELHGVRCCKTATRGK